MNILFETSIIASFLGGMLALFAPCCITFMLPAYFAYTFKQKKAILLNSYLSNMVSTHALMLYTALEAL